MPERFALIVAALTALLLYALPGAGDALLALAAAAALHAGLRAPRRAQALALSAGLLWGALCALALLLLTDRTGVRYVWIYSYSGSALPAHLKLANLWGGDEGTLLLLAAFCVTLAARGAAARTARLDAASLLPAAYVLIVLWLRPFAATPAAWLAQSASQGMNAHLMKVWMLLHAPLILAAYAWTLSLAAPALQALAGAAPRWPAGALPHARRAWALLTAGIGFGMVWAFEDAMYGQVWHWDPVQTAVFAVWCLLGAHLHGVGGWRAGRAMWRWVPATALAAAAMTALAMGVTRNDLLASSHRYVGADTWPAHLSIAALLLIAGVAMAWRGRRVAAHVAHRTSVATWALRATQVGFALIGLWAAGHIAWACFAQWQGTPRPDDLRPFFETLRSWARGSELPLLRTAFAQWDVDGYALARHLLWPMMLIGLVGGWFFLRRLSARMAAASLLIVLLACAAVLLQGGLLAERYAGGGVLSQQIVALLPRVDAALLAGGYLALACAAWSVHAAWHARRSAGYALPLGLLHVGAVIALWGGLVATALNGYSQHLVGLGADWQAAPGGYAFRVTGLAVDRAPDGGRGPADSAFRAVAEVELDTPAHGVLRGQTLYRDGRSAIAGYAGPVRQICEILDYRYARYADRPGYVLHPFIDRSWSRDLQLWVSTSAAVAALEGGPQTAQAVVVLRVLPFASLLWLGLTLATVGALWLALRAPAGSREVTA